MVLFLTLGIRDKQCENYQYLVHSISNRSTNLFKTNTKRNRQIDRELGIDRDSGCGRGSNELSLICIQINFPSAEVIEFG